MRLLIAIPLLLAASGCLFLPGRTVLDRLQSERGTPWATTVFARQPAAGELPLAGLRDTMEYWAAPGSRGAPRWRGVLVPHPEDLYAQLLSAIDGGAARFTLIAYRYDGIGNDDFTLVDYFDADGRRVGWDYLAYGEEENAGGLALIGYGDLRWWEMPQMLLDLPVYLAIGLKELAFEIAKSPFSAIDAGWIGSSVEGRSPLSPVCFARAARAFWGDWRDGFTAFGWRFLVRSRHTPLDLGRDLLGALPVLGPWFDHQSPPASSAPPPATSLIALSQGIHARGDDEQGTAAWRRAIEELRPEAIVVESAYRHGSFFDTIWSMLNLSHGTGYDLAARVVFDHGLRPGDGVELYGFSGGAQRSLAASHALRRADITVNKLIGVAGPAAGFSTARESHLLLGDDPIADPVVLSARVARHLFPLFPLNLRIETVPGADGHHVPWIPHPATRDPRRGYAAAISVLARPRQGN